MKRTFLFALSLVALTASAQKYTVKGTVPDSVKTVYLYNLETPRGEMPDSVAVHNGTFTFSGDAQGKPFATVSYAHKQNAPTIILDGDVTVDLATNKVSGSASNVKLSEAQQRQNAYLEQLRNIQKEGMAYYEKYGAVPDSVGEKLYAKQDKIFEELVGDIKTTCEKETNEIYPIVLLNSWYSYLEKDDVIRLVDSGAAYMNTGLAKRIKTAAEGWRRQVVGVMFTDLEEADTTGTMHKLSEYLGKGNYVLIDFWASWCGPCMKEMPNVKALYDKYHAKGFDVVGLSFDSDKAAWTGAINRLQIGWHHLSDLQGWKSLAGQTYGVNAIPATLLVGPDGKIVANGLRGDKLAQKLAEIYGE